MTTQRLWVKWESTRCTTSESTVQANCHQHSTAVVSEHELYVCMSE